MTGTLLSPEIVSAAAKYGKSSLTQPPLPYAQDALAPTISEETLGFHYGKHHKAYFDNLHKLIEGTPLADASLEEVILASAGDPAKVGVFNNAAQAWNHTFYWHSLTPTPHAPSGKFEEAIHRDFGSFDELKKQLTAASVTQFGSGWGWLVASNGKLEVVKTSNADVPFVHGKTPLLTVDVWEHAYYIDYRNRRPDYVAALIDKLANWDFAAENFAKA